MKLKTLWCPLEGHTSSGKSDWFILTIGYRVGLSNFPWLYSKYIAVFPQPFPLLKEWQILHALEGISCLKRLREQPYSKVYDLHCNIGKQLKLKKKKNKTCHLEDRTDTVTLASRNVRANRISARAGGSCSLMSNGVKEHPASDRACCNAGSCSHNDQSNSLWTGTKV